jgi:ABC-type glutathione transport system ATPase component
MPGGSATDQLVVPPVDADPQRPQLLLVERLVKHYRLPRPRPWQAKPVIRAVDEVSFGLARGETLAVVGESGSGKSTLGRLIVGLTRPTSGRITFNGDLISDARGAALRRARESMQVVFQDPFVSLDPKMPVEDSIAEPLRANKRHSRKEARRRVHELQLDRVHRVNPGEDGSGQGHTVTGRRGLTRNAFPVAMMR